jgi:hypothetical protein
MSHCILSHPRHVLPFALSLEGAKAGPNIATINALLLHRGGVLRFVMEGERVDGALKEFHYGLINSPLNGSVDQRAESISDEGKGRLSVHLLLHLYLCHHLLLRLFLFLFYSFY